MINISKHGYGLRLQSPLSIASKGSLSPNVKGLYGRIHSIVLHTNLKGLKTVMMYLPYLLISLTYVRQQLNDSIEVRLK